jgi:hypothetical protein
MTTSCVLAPLRENARGRRQTRLDHVREPRIRVDIATDTCEATCRREALDCLLHHGEPPPEETRTRDARRVLVSRVASQWYDNTSPTVHGQRRDAISMRKRRLIRPAAPGHGDQQPDQHVDVELAL